MVYTVFDAELYLVYEIRDILKYLRNRYLLSKVDDSLSSMIRTFQPVSRFPNMETTDIHILNL